MRCYQVCWNPLLDYPFFGFHQYLLPNTECPHCGSTFGYASTYLPLFKADETFSKCELTVMKKPRRAPWDEFKRLQSKLKGALAESTLPVPPGADFGRYSVKIRSTPPPISLSNIFAIVASQSVVDELTASGLKLTFFEVDTGNRATKEKFYEIWAPPVVEVINRDAANECDQCERAGYAFTSPVNTRSIPANAAFANFRRITSQPLVTEAAWMILEKYTGKFFSVKEVPTAIG